MARFDSRPLTEDLPRAKPLEKLPELPEQAGRPEDFGHPDVPAGPPVDVPVGDGAPEGLPLIPFERFAQGLDRDLPEEADLPDIFGP